MSSSVTTYEVWSWDLETALMGFATGPADVDVVSDAHHPETPEIYVRLENGWWAVMRKPVGPLSGMRLVPHRIYDRKQADRLAEQVGGYVEVRRG